MRTKTFGLAICFTLLLFMVNCQINRRSEAVIKHATNADESAVKLHAKVHELRASIDQLMAEFEAGKATDVPSKVTQLQIKAERLEEQSDSLKSEIRDLAGEIMRRSDGE